jgi:protein-tyrosine phosphatase
MGLFSKNKTFHPDFSALRVDLHSHVLPGMDDGSPSMTESLNMLNEMVKAGYTKIITTPHVNSDVYPNTKEKIIGQLHHLREVAAEEKIPVEIEASGEYHMDYEFLGKVQSGEVIPFGKKNFLLVELPFQKPAFSYDEVLYQVQLAGYEVIIAHPERYIWLMGNSKLYSGMKDRGMFFQMNLNSLNGLYGIGAKMAAHQLIEARMIEFAGSDAHHAGHVVELHKLLHNRHFDKLINGNTLLNAEL